MKRLMVGLLVVSTSCSLTVPSKYHMPQPIHTARLDRVSVGGFSRVEFRQTGSSVAAWDNSAAAVAVTADTYGNVAAAGAAARNSGFASSYSGYYQATSDTPEFKRDLENTRCAKVVSTTAPRLTVLASSAALASGSMTAYSTTSLTHAWCSSNWDGSAPLVSTSYTGSVPSASFVVRSSFESTQSEFVTHTS